jgi:hypothetical protein
MEEELKEWTISILEYRRLYDNWIRNHSPSDSNDIFQESLMWETYQIYTEDNWLFMTEDGRYVFKIRDPKKFSMARIKYDF